jgi:hypothetical protein
MARVLPELAVVASDWTDAVSDFVEPVSLGREGFGVMRPGPRLTRSREAAFWRGGLCRVLATSLGTSTAGVPREMW